MIIPLLIFGAGAIAIIAYSEGQKSGVDLEGPPPPPPTPIAPPVAPKPTSAIPPPSSPENILERKRIIIARGFEKGIAARQKKHPGEARQASVNAVAQQWRAKGIPLEKPSPAVAFWKKSEEEIANRVATAVNTVSGYRA